MLVDPRCAVGWAGLAQSGSCGSGLSGWPGLGLSHLVRPVLTWHGHACLVVAVRVARGHGPVVRAALQHRFRRIPVPRCNTNSEPAPRCNTDGPQCDTNRADGLRGPHRHASPVRRHAWSVRPHAGSHLMCPCATCARSHVGLWTTAGSVHTERAAGPCGRGRPYRHGHGDRR